MAAGRVNRRLLLALAGATAGAAPGSARAQSPAVPRVGYLTAGNPEPEWTMFRKAMADLGYIEGRTIAYEYRPSDADRARLDELATALVKLEVDVIVGVLSPAILAAKRATTTIPIVFNGGAPEIGAVTNMARPQSNLTGVFGATTIVAGKSVQLFHDIKPSTKSIGVLLNAPDPFHVPFLREIDTVGRAVRIEIVPMMLKSQDELPGACEALEKRGVDGVIVQPSLPLQMVAALALKHRLPAVSFQRTFADSGGFLSYGADREAINRTVADYVRRILRGAKPGDLPVQLATRFELIVNQKTARALGLALPPTFLARADEVIE